MQARLTGCCGCFDLRDGTRAIGIAQLVLGCLLFIGNIVSVAILHLHVGQTASMFAGNLLYLFISARLVEGVIKKSPGQLRAWLIYSGITMGLQSIAVTVVFILPVCIWGNFEFIPLVLAAAALVGVFWYWFVVVLHCYWEMRDDVGLVYEKQKNESEQHTV